MQSLQSPLLSNTPKNNDLRSIDITISNIIFILIDIATFEDIIKQYDFAKKDNKEMKNAYDKVTDTDSHKCAEYSQCLCFYINFFISLVGSVFTTMAVNEYTNASENASVALGISAGVAIFVCYCTCIKCLAGVANRNLDNAQHSYIDAQESQYKKINAGVKGDSEDKTISSLIKSFWSPGKGQILENGDVDYSPDAKVSDLDVIYSRIMAQ